MDGGIWGRKGASNACRTNLEGQGKWRNLGKEAACVMTAILTPECKFHEDRVVCIVTEVQYAERCKEGKEFFFSCDNPIL